MGWVGKVAKIGGMVGTIIPAALLIILGIVYLASGGHSNLDFHSSFFPDLTNFDNVVLAAKYLPLYAGMEMGGIHVKDMQNHFKELSESSIYRCTYYCNHLRLGYILTRYHYPGQRYQPDTEFTCWLRQLF